MRRSHSMQATSPVYSKRRCAFDARGLKIHRPLTFAMANRDFSRDKSPQRPAASEEFSDPRQFSLTRRPPRTIPRAMDYLAEHRRHTGLSRGIGDTHLNDLGIGEGDRRHAPAFNSSVAPVYRP